ncbi:ABC transporter substrate-binding protein [Cellulomonas shaoxiangyii]|uniref:Extracellular solute-binding protein n=1 Tax=Cellulomonas shaoxiangyii TaxID=2566013 RepID=A0A4P7SEH7_9CELL|nr:extracellular solute-binding protein [Cellulomonas shaoxiangyii]QCB92539.1 extracellular solute-binding protein [Cellulomonas shaoxiangyii]TGY84826.1 extracellular solute-binding protein [Cellulomonas shaoxiangyii]
MMRSVLKASGLAAVAALGLAACSGGSGGEASPAASGGADDTTPVTLDFTWWGNDDRAARYTEALELFNEEYPHITVNPNFAAFPDYWTQRSTEAAGRNLPDVMQFDLSYLREFNQSGQLLDLQEHIDNGTIDISGFDETLVESGVLDGKTIGIPTSTNTLGMFYNPNLLEQAGVEFPDPETYTYDEFNEFISSVSGAGLTTPEGYQVYGGGDYTGTFWFFLQYLLQKGVTPFEEDGTLGFDEGDVTEFLELTSDLRTDKAVYPVERGVALKPLGGFTVNENATEMSWDNFLAGYVADSGTENLEITQIPSIEPGEKALFFKPSMLYSIGANTEHPEAAATLVNFLLTDPEVGAVFGTSKGVPADEEQRAAVEAPEGSVDAKVIAYEEAVAEEVTESTPIPVKGFGTLEAKWLELGENLNYGTISIEQFVDEWFAEAEMATM